MILPMILSGPEGLLAVCAVSWLALRFGGEPEQCAAIGFAAAAVARTLSQVMFGNAAPLLPEALAGDLWLAAWLTFIVIHANRGWPLWLGALALIRLASTLAQLAGAPVDEAGLRVLVAVATPLQLGGLAIGIAAHARRQQRIGVYPGWRPRLHPNGF